MDCLCNHSNYNWSSRELPNRSFQFSCAKLNIWNTVDWKILKCTGFANYLLWKSKKLFHCFVSFDNFLEYSGCVLQDLSHLPLVLFSRPEPSSSGSLLKTSAISCGPSSNSLLRRPAVQTTCSCDAVQLLCRHLSIAIKPYSRCHLSP